MRVTCHDKVRAHQAVGWQVLKLLLLMATVPAKLQAILQKKTTTVAAACVSVCAVCPIGAHFAYKRQHAPTTTVAHWR